MKDVLTDIQSGSFAARWIAEKEAGRAEFQRLREQDRDHQIERVGAELRSQMAWLNPVEVHAGQVQAAGRAALPAGPPMSGSAGAASWAPGRIRVFDTTLRDGEQAPGAALTVEEKVEVARQLVRLKVDVIEAGFPAASPGDWRGRPAHRARDARRLAVAGLARCRDGDPQRAVEAIGIAERPHLHVFIATSDIHLVHKLHLDREQALAEAVRVGRATAARRWDRTPRSSSAPRTPAAPTRSSCCASTRPSSTPARPRSTSPTRWATPSRASSARLVGRGRRAGRLGGRRQRPLPQRPGAGHGQHARGRAGRGAPGGGHRQRPRRAGRQRVARGGGDGAAHAARLSSRAGHATSRPSRSPPPAAWSAT